MVVGVLKRALRTVARASGYDIVRFVPSLHPLARRRAMLAGYGVSVVLDVGANVGQYGVELRGLGYRGRIVSFEPLLPAFHELSLRAGRDPRWSVFNEALGASEGKTNINVAGNSFSSSMLDMLASHLRAAPESRYVGKQPVTVTTLDAEFEDLCSSEDEVWLKIDTQGFEERVIAGAQSSLHRINTIQLEMSLMPLYKHETLFEGLHGLLCKLGYRLVSLEPGFVDAANGHLLQVDGIYHRDTLEGL